MKAQQSSRIVGGNPAKGRVTSDFYPTPCEVTEALLRHLDIPRSMIIWEPACGQGHMSRVFEEWGYKVISTDLNESGYVRGGIDFRTAPLFECDWIITNPPFSLAEAFISRCHAHNKPFALLLKSQFWHAASRRSLFKQIPPTEVLPLTWRPDFTRQGSSLMDCIWCVWNGTGPTTYSPLVKPVTGIASRLTLEQASCKG